VKLTASYTFPTRRATLAQVAPGAAESSTPAAGVAPRPKVGARDLVERLLDSGELMSYAAAARRLGISKARMAAIAAFRWLPVEVQEAVIEGRVRSERWLRGIDPFSR
jgi:hypothetical protein